jgi:hypothetical protein
MMNLQIPLFLLAMTSVDSANHRGFQRWGLQDDTHCGCAGCDESVWTTMAGDHSCGDRITWLETSRGRSEIEACSQVAESEFASDCGACDPNTCNPPTPEIRCGCNDCTEAIWNTDAGGDTCGNRISWLQTAKGYSEEDACRLIADAEFPLQCSDCDSEKCDGKTTTLLPLNGHKCGGAVDTSSSAENECKSSLWDPTGDNSMHCFAYGGDGDPCHLSNTNDLRDGLDKDPSNCSGDTFYLWDEPDTQGKDYTWAGTTWVGYASSFRSEIISMREAGTKVTSPLIRAGGKDVIIGAVDAFFAACGSGCRDPSSPAYIDTIAVNAFCGSWNGAPLYCRGGADFILSEVTKVWDAYNLPVYITNWSRLSTSNSMDQVDAINAIDAFFVDGSPIERVYWFSATDYGGGSTHNFLTSTLNDRTTKLGELWKNKCDSL